MKLRNKKTGEIGEIGYIGSSSGKLIVSPINRVACEEIASYNSLAELNEEWEDYEKPKEYWYIYDGGEVYGFSDYYVGSEIEEAHREIGNLFETKEEAEKAVEKLKAWKRLKDKGFRLSAVVDTFFCLDIFMKGEPYEVIKDDLKIVFGGEE